MSSQSYKQMRETGGRKEEEMTVQQGFTVALLVWNIIVFVTYGLDKGKARRQVYRIPEKVLLSIALGLGGIGALAGGYFFRHKTKKWYFKLAWLVGVGIEFAFLYWIWR